MRVNEAKALLAKAPFGTRPQRWMDLGCGDGVFTRALAELLPAGSSIEAWDTNAVALGSIPESHDQVVIHKRAFDLLHTEFPKNMDGIMLANVLHYVADPIPILKKISRALVPEGLLVVAEYDTDIPVATWVPYPISQKRLASLLMSAGSGAPMFLGRRASAYGGGDLYTTITRRSPTSGPK